MIPLVTKLNCAKQVVAHGVGEILIPYFLLSFLIFWEHYFISVQKNPAVETHSDWLYDSASNAFVPSWPYHYDLGSCSTPLLLRADAPLDM